MIVFWPQGDAWVDKGDTHPHDNHEEIRGTFKSWSGSLIYTLKPATHSCWLYHLWCDVNTPNLINLGTTWSLLCAEFTITTQKCTLQHKWTIRWCARIKRHQRIPYIYATVAKNTKKGKETESGAWTEPLASWYLCVWRCVLGLESMACFSAHFISYCVSWVLCVGWLVDT